MTAFSHPETRNKARRAQLLGLLVGALGVGVYEIGCNSAGVAPDGPGKPGSPLPSATTPPAPTASDSAIQPAAVSPATGLASAPRPTPSPAPVATVPCPEDKGDVVDWPAGDGPDGYGDKPRGVCLAKPANGDCASITNACVLGAYHCGYVQHGDKVLGKAKSKDKDACCWKVKGGCAVGRPFVVDGAVRVAPLASGSGWAVPLDLEVETSAALADVWARDGLTEHASVASFAQLILELLALGAPVELVSGAQKALADEIEHARRAFTMASAYAGAPVSPGPLPTHGAMLLAPDLADFAARTASEGCIAETIAALQLHASADAAEDPAIRALLRRSADEEMEHAVLAYRIVRWAIAKGGTAVRDSVRAVFANASDHVGFGPCPDDGVDLRRHGVLSRKARHDLAVEALRDVIAPAGRAIELAAVAAS